MVFASTIFLFWFLPLFLLVYYLIPGLRAKNLWLTVASYVFYGWWRPGFVVLLAISTVVDWYCGRRMGASDVGSPGRRRWLWLSLAANLGLLGFFKYANLFGDTIDALTGSTLDLPKILLPIGISFYTFQSLSYTIDVYRGRVRPVGSVLDFACYVSMFPQLVAGPIVRFRDVAEQLVVRRHDIDMYGRGALLLCIGLSKKVLIADNAALLAELVYADSQPGLVDAWIGTAAYAVQIYFDFSGYSDMAIGLGAMLGFSLPINFDRPYQSASITEFWRRWHISLSAWLRDYLYVPLGGNRSGVARTYVNLMATMLLGGLWHGASWTFMLWGAWQGLLLVIERLRGRRAPWGWLPRPLQVGVTFVLVLIGWAIFRAETVDGLEAIFSGLFGLGGVGEFPRLDAYAVFAWSALVGGLWFAWSMPTSRRLAAEASAPTLVWVSVVTLAAVGQLLARGHSPFLYFRF